MAESLGDTFPEIVNQRQSIETMLDFEQESFTKLVANSEKSFKLLTKEFPQLASRYSKPRRKRSRDGRRLTICLHKLETYVNDCGFHVYHPTY